MNSTVSRIIKDLRTKPEVVYAERLRWDRHREIRLVFNRAKAGLDIFWFRDGSLEQSDNLSEPDVSAQEFVEDLSSRPRTIRKISSVGWRRN